MGADWTPETVRKGREAIVDIIGPALESKYGEAGLAFAREMRDVLDLGTLRKISRPRLFTNQRHSMNCAMLPKFRLRRKLLPLICVLRRRQQMPTLELTGSSRFPRDRGKDWAMQ